MSPTSDDHRGKPSAGLLLRIDNRSRESLQQQIYVSARRAILEGVLASGTRLPSSRSLAVDLRVSRTTTLLAYEQLEAEGYVTARHGSGTFVATELPDDLAHQIVPRRPVRVAHPSLSRRGLALAAIPGPARRIAGPPRPFRIGVPALDLFPIRLWSQLVNRRLRTTTLRQLDYTESSGFGDLRSAIADHIQAARGTRCSADQVFIVAGAQRGLQTICSLLLDPGDRVWCEEPGYPGVRSAVVGADARAVPVRVDAEGLDIAAGRRQARDARMACVTPSHQFPLGIQMTLARRLALLKWASGAGAWIVEDDYDSEFRYGARPIPCLHGLDVDGRVIYVGTFAKTLFPAIRLGFVIIPPDLHEPFVIARRAADLHPPLLEQMVLAEFINGGHYARHLRRMRAAYRERLEALIDAADRICGGALRLRPVQTGLHVVGDLLDGDEERVWEEARLQGVEVAPLSMYFAVPARTRALVLGFGSSRPEALRRGMERLALAIDAAKHKYRAAHKAG